MLFVPFIFFLNKRTFVYAGVTVKKGAVLGSGSLAKEDSVLPVGECCCLC